MRFQTDPADCSLHESILLFVNMLTPLRKIARSFKMSFKLKLCCVVSVPSSFKKEINAFDSFGIEWLVVTILPVDINYGITIMILTERGILCWFSVFYQRSCWFWIHCITLAYYKQPKTFENRLQLFQWIRQLHQVAPLRLLGSSRFHADFT